MEDMGGAFDAVSSVHVPDFAFEMQFAYPYMLKVIHVSWPSCLFAENQISEVFWIVSNYGILLPHVCAHYLC